MDDGGARMTSRAAGQGSEHTTAPLAALLQECVRLDASDLHLAPGQPPTFRVHGDLVAHESVGALARADVDALCAELLQVSGRRGLDETGSQDGALGTSDGTRYRFNVYKRLGGLSAAIRRLEDRFRTLGELGLPERLYDFCGVADGLFVVAGPTGAGKSTTLAALVDRINQTRRVHVITIEDPIEYIHTPAQSLVDQRQVGSDTSSFNAALVASLREDPDVILVGEVRDLDTIRTAIRAAETGHLVLTTVHAGDTVGAIERLVSVFPAEEQSGIRQQLALVLRAVVAQRLITCDGPRAHTPERGGRGRVVASEVMVVTPAVAHLVASARGPQLYTALESGGPHGMSTLEQDLARLVVEGHISAASAAAHARSPALVRERVAFLSSGGNLARTRT